MGSLKHACAIVRLAEPQQRSIYRFTASFDAVRFPLSGCRSQTPALGRKSRSLRAQLKLVRKGFKSRSNARPMVTVFIFSASAAQFGELAFL